uniref:ATP-binding cassette domain-containing protein n=1 Tax=Paracoccus seriniphilus TaxID=184748 RepID=UPI003565F5C5
GRSAAPVAALAEDLHQDLRAGVIDHLRGRVLLATMGHLPESRQALLQLDQQARDTAMTQSRVEWRVAALLQGVAALSLAGTILIAGKLAVEAQIGAAQAALAIFAALALTELGGAMQRGIAELGRMRSAARRIVPALHPQPEQLPAQTSLQVAGGGLQLKDVSVRPMPGAAPVICQFTLSVAPGETVALTGPSGSGKTTLLNAISGLLPLDGGQICRGGRLGYLPQRPALMAGSLRDALHFAAPDSDDHDKDAVLAVCALPIALDYQLGEGGSGLSGGEYRRLALARVLIQRPDILLLDEPTEGLDAATAERVLRGLRDWLPDCAILIAAHRPAERRLADRIISL